MKSSSLKLIFVIACLVLLTQCASVSDNQLQVNHQMASPYTLPAANYLAMADTKEGEEQQSLKIKAAGRLIHDGNWRQGETILARVKPTAAELADEKNLLLAKVDLIRDRPNSAIKNLAKVQKISSLPLYYQSQYHELLAEAYKDKGNASDAIAERIKLDHILPDQASKSNNLHALWLTLTDLPASELNTMAIEADDGTELKGWMELALVSRRDYEHPNNMLQAIETWQTTYSQHPANGLLRTKAADQQLFSQPRQVALLLPLSGPLAGPGLAIRDGFMAAYHASKESGRIDIQSYDTNKTDATALYKEAIDKGANYIVGPLTKQDVAKVAAMEHPVPTLFLNDLNGQTKSNAYQFGLSPDNEARQLAMKARKSGHTRALVIAPTGLWGDEIVAAFAAQWRANGGRVIDTLHYQNDENLDQSLRDFLHISESESRKKALNEILGKKIEATPRRRQDFDMIFLLAYSSKARQIMPMLRYYYAGDMPVYSTSTAYGGNPNSMRDRDLNGIIFCDMPWVFEHNIGNKNWPEQLNSYNRLYALGMDSYALSNQLNQLLLFPAMGVRDKSGILYLKPNGQIARK